ncbi:hypothetical protein LZQ00_12250 [Sphingobacterium sp. SRCM116780]|uniref:hypothetical protein n=1 Tax=Sphingobacterium sp. SRCM116780 TaxID=2907623 RepID=UPI001F324353|nr:hypothetical protein [Sphingobacterium sp. SRCM116780]UIR55050.1 hypothetical protein LZQ00_12250 [Sphingobacterium sp. SRCM116780]
MKNKKWFLIAAAVVLLISLCIIFPIESSKSDFIADYIYTYITLVTAVIIAMYGLMGKNFFKGLLFIFCSAAFSVFCWFFLLPTDELTESSSGFLALIVVILTVFVNFAALFMGTVTGIISGLLFLIVNARVLKDENRYKLFAKRLLAYLLILVIVSMLFYKGGDWIDEISDYFKPN